MASPAKMKVSLVMLTVAVALAAPTPADEVKDGVVGGLDGVLSAVGLPLPTGAPGGANPIGGLPVDNLFTKDPIPNLLNAVGNLLSKVLGKLSGQQ